MDYMEKKRKKRKEKKRKEKKRKLWYSKTLLITPFSFDYKYYLWKTNNYIHLELYS